MVKDLFYVVFKFESISGFFSFSSFYFFKALLYAPFIRDELVSFLSTFFLFFRIRFLAFWTDIRVIVYVIRKGLLISARIIRCLVSSFAILL